MVLCARWASASRDSSDHLDSASPTPRCTRSAPPATFAGTGMSSGRFPSLITLAAPDGGFGHEPAPYRCRGSSRFSVISPCSLAT